VTSPAIESEIDQRNWPNISLSSRHSGQTLTYDLSVFAGKDVTTSSD